MIASKGYDFALGTIFSRSFWFGACKLTVEVGTHRKDENANNLSIDEITYCDQYMGKHRNSP